MKICKFPIGSVRFDKTSYFYILSFLEGQTGPLNFQLPSQKFRGTGPLLVFFPDFLYLDNTEKH